MLELDPQRHIFSPEELSALLGQKYTPTPQQAEVIGADPQGTFLVTAGAGAGKTETMAARVVWLVANGYVLPEQVLGLTFTRKAASELGLRIRTRLGTLARSAFMHQLAADDPRREVLKNISPAVSTYDSYAGEVVREYGLLIPIEPTGRIITDAERWMIARDVVLNWQGAITADRRVQDLISDVQELSDEMDNHLVPLEEVRHVTQLAIQGLEELPKNNNKWSAKNHAFHKAQLTRLDLLPLVQAYRDRLEELQVMTFGQQMSKAAELVQRHPRVGEDQRRRFRVVMLDEYQDTGHAQRILLRKLFGEGQDPRLSVTAVGDPMQSIYMFRGATASNLEKFRVDFPLGSGDPAHKLELTTSWRNPEGVLELANEVAGWSMDSGRTVSELEPRPGAPWGDISLGFFEREDEEITWCADELAKHWQAYREGPQDEPFSAAVLVTKNKQALPIYDALRQRGVPAEMTAGPGLLDLPEVADVYATLRVLVDPEDDPAMLRLLTGPRFNLGAADIAVLSRRAGQLHSKASESGAGRRHLNGDSGDSEGHQSNTQSHLPGMASQRLNTLNGGNHLPEDLAEALVEVIPDPNEMSVGLADAIADFTDAEAQGMSPEGARRIRQLAQELGQLRRHSLAKPLPDLVADIEQMIGVRTEVLTRWFRDPEASIGTSHLEKFASIVRDFSELSGSSPSALVEYLRAAYQEESGLEPGEVQKKLNTVQILTVHKAKGLEWDIVAVPFATRNNFADASQTKSEDAWTTKAYRIPTELRGDAEPDPTTGLSLPIFDPSEAEKSSQHTNAVEDFRSELNKYASKESDRVFYVAITRTERVLMVSGSAYSASRRKAVDPSVALKLIANKALPGKVVSFSDAGKAYSKKFYEELDKGRLSREDELLYPDAEANAARSDADKNWAKKLDDGEVLPLGTNDDEAVWPRPFTQPEGRDIRSGVELFERFAEDASAQELEGGCAAGADVAASGTAESNTTTARPQSAWDAETQVLIEEFQRQAAPEVHVPLGTRLTATEAVSLRRDEEEFARRRRRPVPLEPKPYAKRGTAFHNWVEQHYEQFSLFDEEQLPGASDATLNDPELEKLKSAFLASEWAHRQPVSVEGAYSVSLGGSVFEGRIDAVFHEGNDPTTGWLVVDWKTGRKPTGEDMRAAEIQLGVYRLAWAKVLSRKLDVDVAPEGVRAAFHYVRANETVEPRTLPTAEELVRAPAPQRRDDA